jgi:hypothetical protein
MDILAEVAGRLLALVLFVYIIIILFNSLRIFGDGINSIMNYDEWKNKD